MRSKIARYDWALLSMLPALPSGSSLASSIALPATCLTPHFIFFAGPATRSVTMMSSSKTKRKPLNGRRAREVWVQFSFGLKSSLADPCATICSKLLTARFCRENAYEKRSLALQRLAAPKKNEGLSHWIGRPLRRLSDGRNAPDSTSRWQSPSMVPCV